jgi:hypothetical protein
VIFFQGNSVIIVIMPNRFFLLLILWFTAGNLVAQQPFFDSLALAKRGIRQIVVLSDYKDPDSSSVRVFDTLQVAQLARFQMYPLAPVSKAFQPEMKEHGSGETIIVEDSRSGKSDVIVILHYAAAQRIIVKIDNQISEDSIPVPNPYSPFLLSDSIIYHYNDQQRLTEKMVYYKHKLITREAYTYSRNGLPETAVVYDPKFLLSPEGTCVRKYVYLK